MTHPRTKLHPSSNGLGVRADVVNVPPATVEPLPVAGAQASPRARRFACADCGLLDAFTHAEAFGCAACGSWRAEDVIMT